MQFFFFLKYCVPGHAIFAAEKTEEAMMLAILISTLLSGPLDRDSFSVMFWNLENFFDWKDSGYSDSDREFSSFGDRRWTRGRFYSKCDAVAKAILWTGSSYGCMPDAIGFSEVENGFVVGMIENSTALRKYGYGTVHYESEDTRGIDVALLYRKDRFRCAGSVPHRIYGPDGGRIMTRDILEVTLRSVSGDPFEVVVLVNHHPSKYGGEKESLPGRMAAMRCLVHIADSLIGQGHGNIVAVGDFNDTPDGRVSELMDGVLHDMSLDLFRAGKGTIRYKGKWELIDRVLVSGNLDSICRMDICAVPFLLVEDSASPGKKPFRTYSGPRYNGGVSDHLPVMAFFPRIAENDNLRQ